MKHHTTTKPRNEKQTLRVVCYIRVSTGKQASEGMSLEAQQAKLEAYASLYGHAVVALECDAGASAKSLDRPGLTRALAMLTSGEADALLVMKLDRLTRAVADLATLIEDYFAPGGAALLSVSEQIDTSTAGGRLVLNVLTSVGQWEREAVAERTALVMQHMKSQGMYTGGEAPLGLQLESDGTLTACPQEKAAIMLARKLHALEYSPNHIGKLLASHGYLTRAGTAYHHNQVLRMVA